MARPRKGRTQAAATRREFLQTSAAVGAGFFVANSYAAEPSKSPNERVRLACIGVGGRGGAKTRGPLPGAEAGAQHHRLQLRDYALRPDRRIHAFGKRAEEIGRAHV
mgnify:CR=1 FL=1